jgi:hypothetical protein
MMKKKSINQKVHCKIANLKHILASYDEVAVTRLPSSTSLNELGTWFPDDSQWQMVTSAITKPDIKFMMYAPIKKVYHIIANDND